MTTLKVADAADAALPDTIEADNALVRKITQRLIPFLFLLYVIAYLDRVNVGFAKLQMNELSWFSENVFGVGAGIFFIGYFLFEIPSNLILARVGARKWIMRIMLTWGVIAMAMALVRTPGQFYGMRFLLGLAEAGFFPGVLLYLTYWFTAKERARVVAMFMTANAVSFIFGGPLSTAIMKMPSLWGMTGWQQLFVLEGFPAIVLGFVVLAYLPNGPDDARWLSDAEKQRVKERLAGETRRPAQSGADILHEREHSVKEALQHPVVWMLCGVHVFLVVGMYGFSMWLAQIIKNLGDIGDLQVGLLTAIPYAVTMVAMVANASHSDRTAERRLHIAIPAAVGALGLFACAYNSRDPHTPLAVSMAALTVAAAGMWSTLGPFWAVSPKVLRSPVALAGGIALINATGNLGGFLGPFGVGWLKTQTNSIAPSLCLLACSVICGGLLILVADRRASEAETEPTAGLKMPHPKEA